MTAAVGGVALALDQAVLLELVEQPDEVATVVTERVRDVPLGLRRAFLQHREYRVMLGIEPGRLEGTVRAILDREAQPLEQEGGAREQLLGGPTWVRAVSLGESVVVME